MNQTTKILVVDDEEVVRLSYLRALSGKSCKVELVRNGSDALQMMGQRPFDVVLLDQRMPGLDGMSVLKTIKEKWPESEVIMITGYPAVESAKEAVTLGAYDYLAKPIGPDDVINAANGAMMHKRWALRRDQRAQGATVQ
ncbi:MAG: response regulator [Comamonadaceae bacterium]